MSDPGKTKAEIMADAARDKIASYDEHARELVEKWLEEIRAISAESDEPPLMRS